MGLRLNQRMRNHLDCLYPYRCLYQRCFDLRDHGCQEELAVPCWITLIFSKVLLDQTNYVYVFCLRSFFCLEYLIYVCQGFGRQCLTRQQEWLAPASFQTSRPCPRYTEDNGYYMYHPRC